MTSSHLIRCAWCPDDPIYRHYHDMEWGVPSRDPDHLFEMLLLEGFQAGLSWITILRRRESFRQALLGFDASRLATADEHWLETQMGNPAIIRNRLKLNAARSNAQAWLALSDPVDFIWSFTGDQTIVHHYRTQAEVPVAGPEAQAMSRSLKQAGFKFVGPTICHSYLQAIGCLMDHTTDCYRSTQLAGSPAQSRPKSAKGS